MSGFKINVGVESSNKVGPAKSLLPDSILGVDVDINIKPNSFYESCDDKCYNVDDFNPTPGAVLFDGATAGTPFWGYDDDVSGSHMLTAGHVVAPGDIDQCTTRLSGANIEQYCNDWGSVNEHKQEWDLVFCEPDNDNSIINEIEREETSLPVKGHVTKDGLSYMEDVGYNLQKMGCTTGLTEGEITETQVDDRDECPTYEDHGVETDFFSAQGDSGSPYFDVIDSEAYIVGVHSRGRYQYDWEVCNGRIPSEKTIGISAYKIVDEYDGWFGEGQDERDP